MRFRIGSILKSYTKGKKEITYDSDTLAEALDRLNDDFPGIKFRIVDEQSMIRPHMNIFIDKELTKELEVKLDAETEVFVIQSLSGG